MAGTSLKKNKKISFFWALKQNEGQIYDEIHGPVNHQGFLYCSIEVDMKIQCRMPIIFLPLKFNIFIKYKKKQGMKIIKKVQIFI